MIGIAKTEEDVRNEYGYPRATITGGERSPLTSNIDQSVNKALPWVAFSWLLSGLSLGCVIIIALLMPRIIDSKVSEGIAQARESMAQQAANANAVANEARVHSRVALDKVEDVRTALAEKGIKIELDGH